MSNYTRIRDSIRYLFQEYGGRTLLAIGGFIIIMTIIIAIATPSPQQRREATCHNHEWHHVTTYNWSRVGAPSDNAQQRFNNPDGYGPFYRVQVTRSMCLNCGKTIRR